MKSVSMNQLSDRKSAVKKRLAGILIFALFALIFNSVYGEDLFKIGPYDFGNLWRQTASLRYLGENSPLLQIDDGDWYVFSARENNVMHVTVPLSDLKYDKQENEKEYCIKVEGVVIGKAPKGDIVYFDDDKLVKIIKTFKFSKTGDKAHVSIKAEFLQALKCHRYTRFQVRLWAPQVAGMAYYAMDAGDKNFSGIIPQECTKDAKTGFTTGNLKAFRIETPKGPIEISNITKESSVASVAWADVLEDRRGEGSKEGNIQIEFRPFYGSKEDVVVNKGDNIALEYDLSLPVGDKN